MARKLAQLISIVLICGCAAFAQGKSQTAFTYQGRLLDSAVPASANYDLQFALFDALADGNQLPVGAAITLTKTAVPVVNGIFTVTLDFGDQFPGAERFLEISIRPAGAGSYTQLTPRQAITSAPYSVKSLNADAAVNATNAVNVSGGTISGDGSGITNINGGSIAAGSVTVDQLAPELISGPQRNIALLGSLRWDLLRPQLVVTVGTTPKAIASDGANIWVANSAGASVTKVRTSDGAVIGTYSVGSTPLGIAFDGANIWVTSQVGNNVTKLRASDGAVLGTFNTGLQPQGIAFDGESMWVANTFVGSVSKLRASDGANLGTFPVGGNPNSVAFDGANVWVTNNAGGSVTKLRAIDGAVQNTFAGPINPTGIVFDGTAIWVLAGAPGSRNVMKMRVTDGVGLGTYPTGQAGGIAFDGANIWVAGFITNAQGQFTVPAVLKVRTTDISLIASFTATFPAGSSPSGLAFDGNRVWAANSTANTLTRLPPTFP